MSDGPAVAATGSNAPIHTPVMLSRVCELLSPVLSKPGCVYLDLTCGMGGHARAILEANPAARLVGIDQDAQAIEIARQNLADFPGRVDIVRARFDDLGDVLDELGVSSVQAILADLGLSSLQIDERERGFSYSLDVPLDMRMDDRAECSAADVVNEYSEKELTRIFMAYGEQPAAGAIARAIVSRRADSPFTSSADLVDVVAGALPAAIRHRPGHPAKRVFQALRIEVNHELEALDAMLPIALERCAGRMAVLSYHSLEDRRVKRAFSQACSDQVPHRMPVVPDQYCAQFAPLTRGAEAPDESETSTNPRAASAKLRGVERIRHQEER